MALRDVKIMKKKERKRREHTILQHDQGGNSGVYTIPVHGLACVHSTVIQLSMRDGQDLCAILIGFKGQSLGHLHGHVVSVPLDRWPRVSDSLRQQPVSNRDPR